MRNHAMATAVGGPATPTTRIASDRGGLLDALTVIDYGGSGSTSALRSSARWRSTPTRVEPSRHRPRPPAGRRWPRRPGASRTPTRTPTGTRTAVFASIRGQPRAALTWTDARRRTSADALPVPDTEEVTGSIPVSPTMFVQVSGAYPTWERAASHMARC